jgi:uncharacterized protein (UPF0276 family)
MPEDGALSPTFEAAPGALPNGVGLGLRWEFLEEVLDGPPVDVAFFEVSPENYMRRGGYYPAALELIRDRYPILSHGLTLSLGSERAPDPSFLVELRSELARLRAPFHSDHLSFSFAGERMLHELLPLKFERSTVTRVADHVRAAEDALGLPLALENPTYYCHPGRREMPEAEFIARTLEASGAGLLLDVNNVYVNGRNHGFDPKAFLAELPLERVVQLHVAGHSSSKWGLLIDTHGAPVLPEVEELLGWVIERTGPRPVLLERDNDVPPLTELMTEVERLRGVYERALSRRAAKEVPLAAGA